MKKKILNITLTFLIYIGIIFLSILFNKILPINSLLLRLLIILLIDTIIIYIIDLFVKSATLSKYIWPFIGFTLVIIYSCYISELNTQSYIMLVLFGTYSLNHLATLLLNMSSIKENDWRFDHFKTSKWYPIINLFGIHLLPQILLFILLLPIFYYIEISTFENWNLSSILGVIIVISGLLIKTRSDITLYFFKKNRKNPFEVCQVGLWDKSRHPNYFGELLFWWGTFLMMFSLNDQYFVLLLGPILLTLMISVISIPLMEKKEVKEKAFYSEYQKTTNTIIIGKKKEL